MTKLKTKSAVKKRFFKTATGKIKASACNINHFKSKKSSRALEKGGKMNIVDKSNKGHVKKMAPYGLR